MKFWKTEKVLVFDHEAFKKAREKRGLSACKIGELVGCSAAFIYTVEAGRKKATNEMANKMINALKELS